METIEQVEKQHGGNPADLPLVTLDYNIVITMRNNDPNDSAMQPACQLLALNHASIIMLNVTLSTAFEEQRPDEQIEVHEYAAWLQKRGITPGNIFTAERTISFHIPGTNPNAITFDARRSHVLRVRIHQILFPEVPFLWVEYRNKKCKECGVEEAQQEALLELENQDEYKHHTLLPTPTFDSLEQAEQEKVRSLYEQLPRKWRNKKNDSLGLYHHLTQAVYTNHPEQSVFVTNDDNFFKQTKVAALRELGFPGRILHPADAIAFLCNVTGVSLPDIIIE